MSIPKDDRIAFSLKIVSADEEISGLTRAKAQIGVEMAKVQKLDTANKNLFDPVNVLVNGYQNEFNQLDGNGRSVIVEQDIVDSANRKLQNHFFPNDVNTVVPSLASSHNVWTKVKPFAITFGIGKTYVETYTPVTKEPDLIGAVSSYITAAAAYFDIENTTGQHCVATGMCSNIIYTDQTSCTNNGGIWTPGPDSIEPFPAVQTLKTNIVAAVNTLKTFLLAEVAFITTNDSNVTYQTQNNAAINNINNVIIPALNTWLGYVDFNTAHGQSTCAGFYAYNSNLLAPTKLHSTQLAALQAALNTRSSFITTRISQLGTVLGTIVQDLSTGELISSSGYYGTRYSYLSLRLNIFGGSLTQLTGLQASSGAQDSVISNITSTKATYMSILPTTIFKAPGNDTAKINVVDPSFLSVGDTVFVMAEGQEELLRAVKEISGTLITLNDVVPSKYRPNEKARLYKDIT